MQWKDTTTYSRGDKERKPTTWTLYGKRGNQITITNDHIHYKGEWIMHCDAVGINTKPIGLNSTDDNSKLAKQIALTIVSNAVDTLYEEWDLPKVGTLNPGQSI